MIYLAYHKDIIIKKGTEQTHEVLTRYIPDISIRTAYTCNISCIYHDIPVIFNVYSMHILHILYSVYTMYIPCIYIVYTMYILSTYNVYYQYILGIYTEYVMNIHSISTVYYAHILHQVAGVEKEGRVPSHRLHQQSHSSRLDKS